MITVGNWGFRDDISFKIDSPEDQTYFDSITSLQLVILGPEGERTVKNLSKATDYNSTTKVWSWYVDKGDFINKGKHVSQLIDTTDGRNIAFDLKYFQVGPRI